MQRGWQGWKPGRTRAGGVGPGSLPLLSQEIGRGFSATTNSESLCALTEAMLAVGLLRDEVRQESLTEITSRAATEFVEGLCSGLELFSFEVGVYSDLREALSLNEDEAEALGEAVGEATTAEQGEHQVVLKAWFGVTTDLVDVKPGAEQLNEAVQDLGTLAVECLERALVKFDFAGFRMMEHLAKNYHWYGQDTYAEFVEEMRLCDPESNPEDWDVVTDDDLAQAMPPELNNEQREQAIERCKLACERGDWCGEAARLVCELEAERDLASPFMSQELRALRDAWDPATVPCGMTWGSDRTAVRLLDDYFRNVMECGDSVYEELGVVVLCSSGESESMKVKEALDRCGSYLRKAERLLYLLNGGEIGSSH